jgi:hypothetical protein
LPVFFGCCNLNSGGPSLPQLRCPDRRRHTLLPAVQRAPNPRSQCSNYRHGQSIPGRRRREHSSAAVPHPVVENPMVKRISRGLGRTRPAHGIGPDAFSGCRYGPRDAGNGCHRGRALPPPEPGSDPLARYRREVRRTQRVNGVWHSRHSFWCVHGRPPQSRGTPKHFD